MSTAIASAGDGARPPATDDTHPAIAERGTRNPVRTSIYICKCYKHL